MSSFIHCSMVGVVSVYPQIRKIIQLAFVSCIITISRSSCTMAVLISELFVIAPCAFQCTRLMWVAAVCVPFVVADSPEVEGSVPEKGRYYEQASPSPSRISEKELRCL